MDEVEELRRQLQEEQRLRKEEQRRNEEEQRLQRQRLEEEQRLRKEEQRRNEEEQRLQRQRLEEEQRLRKEEQRRSEEEKRLQQQRLEEEQRLRQESEQGIKPNSLWGLLDKCHNYLSQAIHVERKKTLTTQGDTTNPVNRFVPSRIVPWDDFPALQEEVWDKINRDPTFSIAPLFSSDNDLNYVRRNIKTISSEISLRNFQLLTVDNFVEEILKALKQNEALRQEFHLEGQVMFEDRFNQDATESLLEDAVERMHIDDPSPQGSHTPAPRRQTAGNNPPQRFHQGRRRNRRADQFCVYVAADERQRQVYAVEFKAPHKLTLPELIAGLHEMEPLRDVIDRDGDSFEFHASHLVAAALTQLYSYMIDLGVPRGCLCTGEASVFVDIAKDPTLLRYYLSVPDQDVKSDDEYRLHRTHVAQELAFMLNALAVEPPSQEWLDRGQRQPLWRVEYLDVLKDIPESVRKEPPSSEYKPSSWKPVKRSPYNTRSRASCRPGQTTPENTSGESSDSDDDLPSPSPAPAPAEGGSHANTERQKRSGKRGRGRGQGNSTNSRHSKRGTTRPYCSMECIRGLVGRGFLDQTCPNVHNHAGSNGSVRHLLDARQFTRRLHSQLVKDRDEGFEILDIRGRTGFLLKATLLSHGYTVIIKATTEEKEHSLQKEIDNYRRLRELQGRYIPVCVGSFRPRVSYWYHGELMSRMMILSWSGARVQTIINKGQGDIAFFQHERKKLLEVLASYGAVHRDTEWRNMLWNDGSQSAVMIDFEDVSWSNKRLPLCSTSGNTKTGPRLSKRGYLSDARVAKPTSRV